MHWKLLIVIVILLALPSAALATITASISAHRTSCYAPCVVHFDGFTSTADTNRAAEGDRFKELHYVWDYGDSSSTTWSATSGQSMNSDIGPIAAHVFDPDRWSDSFDVATCAVQPAGKSNVACKVYTVTLSVGSPEGDTDQDTETIYVWDPDDSDGLATYCFSNAGTCDAACPTASGATCVNSVSDFDTIMSTYLANDRQLLFETGDTFNQGNDEQSLNYSRVRIGSYGSGAKPIIANSATASDNEQAFNDHDANDVVVSGLHLQGSGATGIKTWVMYRTDGEPVTTSSMLWYRNQISAYTGIFRYGSTNQTTLPQVFLVETSGTGSSMACGAGSGTYMLFLFMGAKSALLGNIILGESVASTCHEHVLRAQAWNRWVIAHNEFGNSGLGKETVTLRGCDDRSNICTALPDSLASKYLQFSYNNVHTSGIANGDIIGVYPANKTAGDKCCYQRSNHGIFDSNLIEIRADNYGTDGIVIQEDDYVTRNNLCFQSNSTLGDDNAQCVSYRIARLCVDDCSVVNPPTENPPQPDGGEAWGNTFWWADADNNPSGTNTVAVSYTSTNNCGNNLYYNPAETTTTTKACSTETVTTSHGSNNLAILNGAASPFAGAAPSTWADFKVNASSAPEDYGTNSEFNLVDIGGNCRHTGLGGDTPNAGAWEENEAGATACVFGAVPPSLGVSRVFLFQ
jgi:hypothetical protein